MICICGEIMVQVGVRTIVDIDFVVEGIEFECNLHKCKNGHAAYLTDWYLIKDAALKVLQNAKLKGAQNVIP